MKMIFFLLVFSLISSRSAFSENTTADSTFSSSWIIGANIGIEEFNFIACSIQPPGGRLAADIKYLLDDHSSINFGLGWITTFLNYPCLEGVPRSEEIKNINPKEYMPVYSMRLSYGRFPYVIENGFFYDFGIVAYYFERKKIGGYPGYPEIFRPEVKAVRAGVFWTIGYQIEIFKLTENISCLLNFKGGNSYTFIGNHDDHQDVGIVVYLVGGLSFLIK